MALYKVPNTKEKDWEQSLINDLVDKETILVRPDFSVFKALDGKSPFNLVDPQYLGKESINSHYTSASKQAEDSKSNAKAVYILGSNLCLDSVAAASMLGYVSREAMTERVQDIDNFNREVYLSEWSEDYKNFYSSLLEVEDYTETQLMTAICLDTSLSLEDKIREVGHWLDGKAVNTEIRKWLDTVKELLVKAKVRLKSEVKVIEYDNPLKLDDLNLLSTLIFCNTSIAKEGKPYGLVINKEKGNVSYFITTYINKVLDLNEGVELNQQSQLDLEELYKDITKSDELGISSISKGETNCIEYIKFNTKNIVKIETLIKIISSKILKHSKQNQ